MKIFKFKLTINMYINLIKDNCSSINIKYKLKYQSQSITKLKTKCFSYFN